MTCTVCGAPADRARSHCAVCGYTRNPESAKTWDRAAEANAFEDLSHAVDAGEPLLGVTRGRVTGTWRRALSFQPQAMLSPYVNLGLTPERLILQQVHAGTGRAVSDKGSGIPLQDVTSVTGTDADPLEPGRTARLVIQVSSGESFRLRAAGRFADGALGIVDVWRSLTSAPESASSEHTCVNCGRTTERPSRFCPFCGAESARPGE